MNPVALLPWLLEGLRYARVAAVHVSALSLAAALTGATLLLLGGCTACQTVIHNFADLDDDAIFASRSVASPPRPSALHTLARTPSFMAALQVPGRDGSARPLLQYLDETRTAAFVVMREDRIVFEHYARGYSERSLLNSFSIAKSIVATLVGIAYAEGRIMSLDATVADYRPDLATSAYAGVTVRDLLRMTSGVGDAPSILPGQAQYYYGRDLHETILRGRASGAGAWRYSEADVQVLGFVLQAAVGRSLSDYLAEKLWQPLGMESPAHWALDRPGGVEKAFCCISARARDFARFGLLQLRGGTWDGEQVVPAEWSARKAIAGVPTPDGYTHSHLWWEPEGDEGDFYAYGHNGQFIYVNPRSRTVIVKFSETNHQDPVAMFRAVSRTLERPEHRAEIEGLARESLAAR